MSLRALLLAAAFAASASSGARVYRIELAAGGVIWADDAPMQSGEQILFHGHPAGALQSLRRTDVKRIVSVAAAAAAGSSIKPGEAIDIGVTGSGSRGRLGAPARASTSGNASLRPGEAKGGTALFNPDRAYRPDWDGKLVPGTTMGLPNSPNDYREGSTLAHPAAGASQSAPGEPPMMKPSSGELPKPPNQ
ncbi:MAG: hypothetical protein ACRD1B_10065 [Thermoanaerobaculia bacterium]